MTNPPSGSKRPHPDPEHARRPRERDEPRDWRDIHLTHDGPGQGQGRRGHRGGKDRNRERDRRDRDRNRREDSRDRRDSHRHDDSRGPKSSLLPKPDDAEREEGE
jgi:serine/threonine-protein kinase PRP4